MNTPGTHDTRSSMTEMAKVNGVYAAALTPVGRDGRPDIARFTDFARHLLANGCDGLAPLGTTGEANSIGLAHRLAFIEGMAAAGLPMQRMIPGTGSPALADAALLSQTALDAGAQGVLVLPPFYYKQPSEDGLFAFFAGLAERLRGSPRIYLYHFPQMSAVPVTLQLVARLREAFPGVFVGLKDSSGDFANTAAFIERFPDFEVFSGTERFLLDTLRAGGTGCISATTNITAHLARKVMAEWRAGTGEAAQAATTAARLAVQGFPLVPALRAVVAALRDDPSWIRPLPPLMPLDETAVNRLFSALAALEGFEWLSGRGLNAAE